MSEDHKTAMNVKMNQDSANSFESQGQTPFALRVNHLSKTFSMGWSTLKVLKDVTLDVRRGETVSIVGSSGSGKSTLLHIIGGIEKPTGGSVIFQGQDLYEMSGSQRTRVRACRIGFVFQFYHLLPDLDVLENVILPARNHGSRQEKFWAGSGSANRDRGLALLKSVGLEDRSGYLPTELSGGEQQRVALARALMNQPDVVLADEPTGNLDSVTGDNILDILLAMTREKGKTLILVTHNLAVARRCDHVMKLEHGCLAFY